MTWRMTVVGSVALDDVLTPHGHRTGQMGGSALYCSLAASRYVPVHLVGIVGKDAEAMIRETVSTRQVDLGDLEVSHLPTYRWHAIHDFTEWRTKNEHAEYGAYAAWQPVLSTAARSAEVLFIGSMNPHLQQAILDQVESPAVIAIDSMEEFIRTEHELVQSVIHRADILFLNIHEISALLQCSEDAWETETGTFLAGAPRLRAVVVKLGPEGAALITRDRAVRMPAAPVDIVIDPTGAGDALAGGFLGTLATHEDAHAEAFDAALLAGLFCAADAISTFGVQQLRDSSRTGSTSGAALGGSPIELVTEE